MLWWRWAGRDLRQRWVFVVAIALVIAAGTGAFAGLGSTTEWRRQSNDRSYAVTRFHDLRVRLTTGNFTSEGSLDAVLRGMGRPEWAAAATERLVVPVQVDASTAEEAVVVPGEAVGVEVTAGGTPVDRPWLRQGRALRPDDAGRPVALLEDKFATTHDLPTTGTLRVSGGREIEYVGRALFPEHLMVIGRAGDMLAEGNFAVLEAPRSTVQQLAGLPGMVNDLVLALPAGADAERARDELEAALASALPGVSAEVLVRDDNPAYRVLYDDIDTDSQFWNVIALLMLASAAFAAFNLTSRVVEAERREIGVGMALGVSGRRLALRPLAMAVQVALVGVVAGVGVGLLVDEGLRGLYERFLPLPVWHTPFQVGHFARGAALGFVLPVIAAVVPVWRAVRVEPVEAIATGSRTAAEGGLAPLLRDVPLPGHSYDRMPIRNVLRTPRRTLLTALGIGAAVTALFAVLGMVDSFVTTVERGEHELLRAAPGRLEVGLDRFYATDSPEVDAVRGTAGVGGVTTQLRVPGELSEHGEHVEVVVDVLDFDAGPWRPTIVEGSEDGGVVLSYKAAADLGVEPGDSVRLRHPQRTGPETFALVTSNVRVAGLHPNPLRVITYVDTRDAGFLGLEGATNVLVVEHAPGATNGAVQRGLFDLPGVASAQPVNTAAETFRDLIDQFVSFLRLIELVALAIALLIAFNSAGISADERRREYATMFAFGLRVRTVLRMAVTESVLVGLFGTALGLGAGWLVLRWMITSLIPNTTPEIGIALEVSPSTVALIVGLGVVAVAVAPLLTARRLRRLDISGALRVIE